LPNSALPQVHISTVYEKWLNDAFLKHMHRHADFQKAKQLILFLYFN